MQAEISGYRFVKVNSSTIEVYSNDDDEFPYAFIKLKVGDLRNAKDFHYEIMDWYAKNISLTSWRKFDKTLENLNRVFSIWEMSDDDWVSQRSSKKK